MIVVAWASSVLALLLILSTVAPFPKAAELSALRLRSFTFGVGCTLSLLHIAAASKAEEARNALVLGPVMWAAFWLSTQLRALLPLRAEAIRRAAHVDMRSLRALAGCHAACATVCVCLAKPAFDAARSGMLPSATRFDLCLLGFAGLHHAVLAIIEGTHIADEMAHWRTDQDTPEGMPDARPSFASEMRADLREALQHAHGIVENLGLLMRHMAMIHSFGVRARISDALLLTDMRHFASQLLRSWQAWMQSSLCLTCVHHTFETASVGAMPSGCVQSWLHQQRSNCIPAAVCTCTTGRCADACCWSTLQHQLWRSVSHGSLVCRGCARSRQLRHLPCQPAIAAARRAGRAQGAALWPHLSCHMPAPLAHARTAGQGSLPDVPHRDSTAHSTFARCLLARARAAMA